MDVWHGIPSNASTPINIRSTATGTVTVTHNGVDYTASADTAVHDGLVTITIPATSGTVTITTPNDSDSLTLRGIPATGEVRLGYWSCGKDKGQIAAWQLVNRDVDIAINIGDLFYGETGAAGFGEEPTHAANTQAHAEDQDNWYSYYRLAWRNHPLDVLRRSRGVAHRLDDHEYAINDCQWSVSDFQTFAAWVSDLDDCRIIVDNANEAYMTYGHPLLPANPDTVAINNPYFTRFDAGEHCEVFVISGVCAGYDTDITDRWIRPAAGVGVDMIPAAEEAWLLVQLAASTKTFKVIMSPKQLHQPEFGNGDTFDAYPTQMERLLQAIHDNSPGWTVPGGVMWCAGDTHAPSVHGASTANGDSYDYVCVTACPAGQDSNALGVKNSGKVGANTLICNDDGSGAANSKNGISTHLRNVGIVTIAADGGYLQSEIVLADGSVWWAGRLLPGQNTISYPELKQ